MDTVQACHIRKGLPNHLKGGMGMKPPDRVTIPMCHEHHSLNHAKGDISFWGDMDKPIELANALYVMTGDREKAIHHIIRFNSVFRNQK
jgi:hypothetical protein